MKKNNIRLLQYLCNCHDSRSVELAEKNNFKFTDIRITLELNLNKIKTSKLKTTEGFRKATILDYTEIQKISKSIYKDSRYYFDKNFDKDKIQIFL